jgi:hypothetical protein
MSGDIPVLPDTSQEIERTPAQRLEALELAMIGLINDVEQIKQALTPSAEEPDELAVKFDAFKRRVNAEHGGH